MIDGQARREGPVLGTAGDCGAGVLRRRLDRVFEGRKINFRFGGIMFDGLQI
jgi:hypothetical protein